MLSAAAFDERRSSVGMERGWRGDAATPSPLLTRLVLAPEVTGPLHGVCSDSEGFGESKYHARRKVEEGGEEGTVRTVE